MLTPIASSGPYIDTAVPFHFTGSATASAGPGGAYTILTTHAVGEGGTWHIGPLTPGVSQNVVVHTGNGTSIFRAAVTGGSATSASHNIMSGASVNTTLNFIPNTTFVDIEIADNSPFGGTNSVQIFGFTIDTVTYIPQTVVATITSGDDYHYGFNGQIKTNEWAGVGNHLDFKFRGYDPRVGRFNSVDPLSAQYPWNGSYNFAEGRVIDGVDLEGKEFYSVHMKIGLNGARTKLQVINYTNVPHAGMVNVPTKDGYGPRGDVGVTYVTHQEREKYAQPYGGGVVGTWDDVGEFSIKNLYGVYAGADNPKKYWEQPDPKTGEYKDDYSLPPIDETDANALQHDHDYDYLYISGFSGVMDDRSTPANEAFMKRADKTVEKYKKKEKDGITGKPVTKQAADAAYKYSRGGIKSFETAEEVKHYTPPEGPKE